MATSHEAEERDLVTLLRDAESILILVGAGLSQPSGVPTFQQDNGEWHGHKVRQLAEPARFRADPVLLWQFHEHRRRVALRAHPNAAHFALVKLVNSRAKILTISQNIDGLLERAQHPTDKLVNIHGSLFGVRCSEDDCAYRRSNTGELATVNGLEMVDVGSVSNHITIPPCPSCGQGTLRPGVIWYGEDLPKEAIQRIDGWLEDVGTVDLMLLIGTERDVFVGDALARGAELIHFNIFDGSTEAAERMELLGDDDWIVNGDVAYSLPKLIDEAFGAG